MAGTYTLPPSPYNSGKWFLLCFFDFRFLFLPHISPKFNEHRVDWVFPVTFAFFPGSFSQFVLNQPASVTGSLGETVRISCKKSSGTIGTYDSSWYQQKPGSAPKLMIYYDGSTPSGIPARFSGSFENSRTSAVLSISNLEAEDEAIYYCASYTGSGSYTVLQFHWTAEQKPSSRGTPICMANQYVRISSWFLLAFSTCQVLLCWCHSLLDT